jgi:hypothetical protein
LRRYLEIINEEHGRKVTKLWNINNWNWSKWKAPLLLHVEFVSIELL